MLYMNFVLVIGPSTSNNTLDGRPPLVIGHRGAPGFGGENTLVGFRKAIELGADGFELDLILTKDKKLAVLHDFELSRLVGKEQLRSLFPYKVTVQNNDSLWLTKDFRLNELQRLHITYPAPSTKRLNYKTLDTQFLIPSYAQALDLFIELRKATSRSDLILYTEIKTRHEKTSTEEYESIISALKTALESKGLDSAGDNIWIQSFDHHLMEMMGQSSTFGTFRKAQLAFDHEEEIRHIKSANDFKIYIQQKILDKNLQMLHLWKVPLHYFQEELNIPCIRIAHDMGVAVHLYTFRDTRFYSDYKNYYPSDNFSGFESADQELRYFIDKGVDAIMSDFVVSGRELVK